MKRTAPRRYAFDALEVMARCESPKVLAERLGVNERQVFRWRMYGVTEEQADRLAPAVGFHPWSIWPELAAVGTRVCESCVETFMPHRKDQRFCSGPCNRRWWSAEMQRRRRRRDPEWAQRERDRKRVYYAECREYVCARERRAYQLRKETSDA